jgi:hypothetical protein
MRTARLLTDVTYTATGIVLIHQIAQSRGIWDPGYVNTGIQCFSVSVALNVLLTFMIVARLILHSRRVMGSPAKLSVLYKAVIAMLVESSALYTVNYLLFIVPWGVGNPLRGLFFPILAETQVRVIFTFPRRAAIVECDCLIVSMGRSLLRFSSQCESPTRVHGRAELSFLGTPDR